MHKVTQRHRAIAFAFRWQASAGYKQIGEMMLELRPGCEQCDKDLPPESTEARICTFECTFCADCATQSFNDVCPNCDGEFVTRPRRPADRLRANPASTKRVFAPR